MLVIGSPDPSLVSRLGDLVGRAARGDMTVDPRVRFRVVVLRDPEGISVAFDTIDRETTRRSRLHRARSLPTVSPALRPSQVNNHL